MLKIFQRLARERKLSEYVRELSAENEDLKNRLEQATQRLAVLTPRVHDVVNARDKGMGWPRINDAITGLKRGLHA